MQFWDQPSSAQGRAGVPLLALVVALFAAPARAHPFDPPLLALTERAPGEYDVVWRIPAQLGAQALAPVFPPGSVRIVAGARVREGDALVERFRIRVPGGLGGKQLALDAPARGQEVLLRIGTPAGVVMGRLLSGGRAFVVPHAPDSFEVARTYVELGVEHILTGLDHLLFVLGLCLLAPSIRALCLTVTAFTLAHSFTLALAALGKLSVPPAPVEACIALSIVFVARELWGRGRGGRPYEARRLWSVAFGFGLLHGLGFAGALAEVGLPPGDVPLALVSFNVGVELGQLGFVAVVLALARWTPLGLRAGLQARRVPAYAIGAIAACFFLERVAAIFA